MKTLNISILVGLCLAGGPALAAAQDHAWYVGGSVSAQGTRFTPRLTYYDGDELDVGNTDEFVNRATGPQLNLLAGQRFRLGRRFSLAYQGAIGVNWFEWTLSLPDEPAELRYALPFTALLTVVPEVHLGDRVAVFGEFGGGTGRVREIKTSPTSSAYDVRVFRPVVAGGGGLRFTINDRIDAFLQYQHLWYSSLDFDTFTAAGERSERIDDAPRASWSLLWRDCPLLSGATVLNASASQLGRPVSRPARELATPAACSGGTMATNQLQRAGAPPRRTAKTLRGVRVSTNPLALASTFCLLATLPAAAQPPTGPYVSVSGGANLMPSEGADVTLETSRVQRLMGR